MLWNTDGNTGSICATEFSCESGGCRGSASACCDSGGGMSPGLLGGISGSCNDIFAGKGTCRLAVGLFGSALLKEGDGRWSRSRRDASCMIMHW